SHFNPKSPDSFFYRSRDNLEANPQARLVIATYGRVGSELAAAVRGDAQARERLAAKLSKNRPDPDSRGRPQPPYITKAEADIVPVEDRVISEDEREKLAKAFYSGIAAQYKHILADLDVVRSEKLREVAGKFQRARVVIVHGASGQGKTTLAYRYLREYFPEK